MDRDVGTLEPTDALDKPTRDALGSMVDEAGGIRWGTS